MSLRALDRTPATAPAPHGHGAEQRLSHQFEDIDQQNESYVVGMWTFLVTEVMFFGALFLAYSIYRVLYFSTYLDAHRFLDLKWGFINTLVLLTSSLSMAFAVWAAQNGKRLLVITLLGFTVFCSFAFLGIKSIEYKSKFDEKLFPGATFDYAFANEEYARHHSPNHGESGEAGGEAGGQKIESGVGAGEGGTQAGNMGAGRARAGTIDTNPNNGNNIRFNSKPKEGFNSLVTPVDSYVAQAEMDPQSFKEEGASRKAQLFFSLYFAMTGLHAVHIIIGIIMMSILMILYAMRHPSVDDYMPTEMIGLYWHFVDIVWIFLFPLMYLIS